MGEVTDDVPIVHFTAERVPNWLPRRQAISWQDYHAVRNAVFRCCHKFGATGALGERRIKPGKDENCAPGDWAMGDDEPWDFFLIDDQYNDERYVYVEVVNGAALTSTWLRALQEVFVSFDGWGIGICGLVDGYILVFVDKVMVQGSVFENCHDLDSVAIAARRSIEAKPK